MGKANPGFNAVSRGVAAKQGIPLAQAKAIVASGTRNASPAAKRRNPRLKRVLAKKKSS